MIRDNNEVKDKINILLNTDNYYGSYKNNLTRILIYIVSLAIPFMIYTLLLALIIQFRFFIVPFILYALRMALIIIGREAERKEDYIKQMNDDYATAKELIRIVDIHDDGLIEYSNNFVVYIISTYGYSYMSDNVYSRDLEEFIEKITNKYDVDIYGHLVIDELDALDNLEKLRVYKDKEFLKERLEFYKYQDDYSSSHSKLYRINFAVRCFKDNWFNMRKDLIELVKSENSMCFDIIKICNRDEVIDVISRDSCLYVDIKEMLLNKHNADNFFGSKVLYFGDNKPKEEDFSIFNEEGRRVIEDDK